VSNALPDAALRHAAVAIFANLAEAANRFAKTDRQCGDGFEVGSPPADQPDR